MQQSRVDVFAERQDRLDVRRGGRERGARRTPHRELSANSPPAHLVPNHSHTSRKVSPPSLFLIPFPIWLKALQLKHVLKNFPVLTFRELFFCLFILVTYILWLKCFKKK